MDNTFIIVKAHVCKYCYCLINNPRAGHRCPVFEAPLELKEDPSPYQLEFLEKLDLCNKIFIEEEPKPVEEKRTKPIAYVVGYKKNGRHKRN